MALTTPADGATVTLPDAVTLTATASDADRTVARVELYAGTTLLGTDATSPYSVTWTGAAGTDVLKAVAVDHRGASTTSGLRNITVRAANAAPTVSLTSPIPGATFTAPDTITLTATASDADGTIARVDFYSGTTLLGTDTTNPYSMTWVDVPAGACSLTAVARDDRGAVTVSGALDIAVGSSVFPTKAVFVPASNHDVVDRYVLEFFVAGADPDSAAPVATHDLGRPAVVDGQCVGDVRITISALAPGSYFAVVTAISSTEGSLSSAPSPVFTR